jgi:hypothetical protein
VEWDVTRYAERLPKKPSKPGTKASNEREASLRRRYPPLNGVTASIPCIIVDMQGIILAWYLPGILTDSRQVVLCSFALPYRSRKPDTLQDAMLGAREKLRPLLGKSQHGSCWRDDLEHFHLGGEGPWGSVNLSPGWFQQGHDVSASAHSIHFSAAHSESGNGATIPAGFCELQRSCCIGLARCYLRVQCSFERNPGSDSSKSL